MIYLDTSVVLAQLLAEDRRPHAEFWAETFVSSRLLEYEVWVRINARGLAVSHGPLVERALARIAFVEMLPPVLTRAFNPFPIEVRTLDAVHLATLEFLVRQKQRIRLATYDERMRAAAESLGFSVEPLG